MAHNQFDHLLDARCENVAAMKEEDYKKLVDGFGLMTKKQLDRCIKEGSADHLRDVAREEIVARAASSSVRANVGIVIGLVAVLVAILAWLFPRTPHP